MSSPVAAMDCPLILFLLRETHASRALALSRGVKSGRTAARTRHTSKGGNVADEPTLEGKVFEVPEDFRQKAIISSFDQYEEMYRRSMEDGDAFWADTAERITWFKKWDRVQNHDFANARIRWYEGGKLNAAYNCLDRHLETDVADKVAFYWEGDDPNNSSTITYRDLREEVTKFANVLKKRGVKKGDRVTVYLPM